MDDCGATGGHERLILVGIAVQPDNLDIPNGKVPNARNCNAAISGLSASERFILQRRIRISRLTV